MMDIHETTAQAERLVLLVKGYVAGWRWAYTVACNYLGDNPDNPFSECWKNWPEFRQPVLAYAASTLVGQTTKLSPEECLERNPWGAVLGAIRREFIPIEPELARFGWPPSVPMADFWDTPQAALIERMIADGYCDEVGVDWSKSQIVGFAIVAEMEKELALLRKCVDGLRREAIRAKSSEQPASAANPTATIPSETQEEQLAAANHNEPPMCLMKLATPQQQKMLETLWKKPTQRKGEFIGCIWGEDGTTDENLKKAIQRLGALLLESNYSATVELNGKLVILTRGTE